MLFGRRTCPRPRPLRCSEPRQCPPRRGSRDRAIPLTEGQVRRGSIVLGAADQVAAWQPGQAGGQPRARSSRPADDVEASREGV